MNTLFPVIQHSFIEQLLQNFWVDAKHLTFSCYVALFTWIPKLFLG